MCSLFANSQISSSSLFMVKASPEVNQLGLVWWLHVHHAPRLLLTCGSITNHTQLLLLHGSSDVFKFQPSSPHSTQQNEGRKWAHTLSRTVPEVAHTPQAKTESMGSICLQRRLGNVVFTLGGTDTGRQEVFVKRAPHQIAPSLLQWPNQWLKTSHLEPKHLPKATLNT